RLTATAGSTKHNRIFTVIPKVLDLEAEVLVALGLPKAGEILRRIPNARIVFRGYEGPDVTDGSAACDFLGLCAIVQHSAVSLLGLLWAEPVCCPGVQWIGVAEHGLTNHREFPLHVDGVAALLVVAVL